MGATRPPATSIQQDPRLVCPSPTPRVPAHGSACGEPGTRQCQVHGALLLWTICQLWPETPRAPTGTEKPLLSGNQLKCKECFLGLLEQEGGFQASHGYSLELVQWQLLLQALETTQQWVRALDPPAVAYFQASMPSRENRSLKVPKQDFWMVCLHAVPLCWHWPRPSCFPMGSSRAEVQHPYPAPSSHTKPFWSLLWVQPSPSTGLVIPRA